MSDKARSIYDKIINSKVASEAELGTPEMFTQYVSSPGNATKIYQKLLSQGLSEAELGTQDMFVSAIVPKSSVSVKAPTTTQSPTATTTGIKAQEQRSSNEVSAKKQDGEKGDWWIQDLADKLNEGSANVFGGVLGWLGEGEDLINKGISSATTAITGKEYDIQPQTGWFAQAANYCKQEAERSRQAVNRFDGKSIDEQLENKEYGAYASQILLDGASSLPASIGMMVAPQVFIPATIASSSNNKYDELKEREDLSTTAKLTNAVTTGLIEAATERIGSIPVGGWLKSLYFKGAETGTKVFKKALMDEVTKLYKRYGLLLVQVGEGVEEAIGKAGENFTDWVTGVTDELNLTKGTGEAFAFGFGGGLYFTAMGIPGTISNEVQRNKIKRSTKGYLDEVLGYTKKGGLAEEAVQRVVLNAKNNTIKNTIEETERAILLTKEESGYTDVELSDIREKLLATVYGTRKLHQYYDRQSDAELLLNYYKDKAKNDITSLADEDGNITKVTLSDRRVVSVVSGSIKVNENGQINFEESSPTLIVADESGKRVPVQTNGNGLRVESLVSQTPAQQEVENVTGILQQKYEIETKYPLGTVVYVTDEQGNIIQNEDGTNQSSTIKDYSEDGVIIDTDQGEINLPFALAQNSLLTETDVKERLHTTFTPDTEVKSGNGEGFLYIKGIKDAASNTYEVSMYDNNREFVDTIEMSGKDIYDFGKNKMTEMSAKNEGIQPVEDSKMTEEGEFEQKVEQITFPTKKEGGYDFAQFTPEHHYLFAAKTEGDKVANQDLKTAIYAALGNIQKQQDKINKAPFEKKAALRAELLLLKSKYDDLKALEDKYIPKEEHKPIPQRKKTERKTETKGIEIIYNRWDEAKKTEGIEDEIILPNGETIKGRYYLTESTAMTPSHDPETFNESEGFPTVDGATVNSRDYKNDKNAQTLVAQSGNNYDGRAIQTPVFVKKGIVFSGNHRTIAGQLAAKNNTDTKYVEYVQKYGKRYGFTAEQISEYQHPRIVFVPDVDMPYTVETFDKFNAEDKKTQSKTEQAVKISKTVNESTIIKLSTIIEQFELLSELYASTSATNDILFILEQDGVIGANEIAKYKDGDVLSETGKEFVETILAGSVLKEDAIRVLSEMKGVRQNIVKSIVGFVANRKLSSYALTGELNDAIKLIYQVNREVGKMPTDADISMYMMQPTFGADFGDNASDLYNSTVQIFAKGILKGQNELKRLLSIYNQKAELYNAGQIDAFEGLMDKEELLTTVLKGLGHENIEQGTKRSNTSKKTTNTTASDAGDRGSSTKQPLKENIQEQAKNIRNLDDAKKADIERRRQEELSTITSLISTAENRRPNGSIGTQGFDPTQMRDLIKFLNEKLSLNIDEKLFEGEKIKPLIDSIKDNEELVEKIKQYVKTNPIEVSIMPDGSVSFRDGNHRANLLNLIGSDILPTIEVGQRSKIDEINAKYDAELNALEEQTEVEQPIKKTDKEQTSKEDKRTSDEKALDESILSQSHNSNPTEKQKETGVYDKARINVQGYNITLETLKGQERKGTDNNGKAWSIVMNNHYGELDGTVGYDGDAIDVFVGPNPKSGQTFVIDQINSDGTFDESKVMLGFKSAEEAKAAYMSNYEKGWKGFGSITPAGDNFKAWLYDGKKQRKPYAEYKDTPEAVEQSESTRLVVASKELTETKAKYDKAYNRYLDLKNKLEKDPAFGMGGQVDIFGNVSGADNMFGNDGQKQAVEAVQASKKQADDLKIVVDELQAKVNRLNEAIQDKARGQQEMKFEEEKAPEGLRSDNNDIQFQAIENDNKLVVLHNIRAEGILNIDKLGALPMPSLAITKQDAPLEGYGEITLIGDKRMVDPQRGTRTFGADIYSARYPKLIYQISKQGKKLIEKAVELLPESLQSSASNRIESSAEEGLIGFVDSNALKAVFIAERGNMDDIIQKEESEFSQETLDAISKIKGYDFLDVKDNIEARKQITELYFAEHPNLEEYRDKFTDEDGLLNFNLSKQLFNSAKSYLRVAGMIDETITFRNASAYVEKNKLEKEWKKYATDFYNSLNVEEKIFKGYSPSGTRRYVGHTIENVIKAMKTKNLRGAEKFFYGAGSVRAKVAPEFKSISDIKKHSESLVSEKEFEEVKDEINKEFSSLLDKLVPFYKYERDMAESLSEEIISLSNRGVSESFNKLSDEVRTDLVEFIEKIKNAPTGYFEAKPTREVYLSEFTAAVVPADTDPKVIEVLENSGLKVERYTDNRAEVVQRVAERENVSFQAISPIGFYSTVEKALESINQEKGTKEQFKQMLLKNGAKQAEMDWMGWDDQFPDATKKVSKEKQLDIIQSTNPMLDDYHVGIRKLEDIKTFDQVVDDSESFVYGDFSKEDAQKALKEGSVTVYGSKPIKNGAFVSTSENQAKDYAGNGKVYSQKVNLGDVAWISGDEGQMAKADNTITKADIQNWIDENRIEVKETAMAGMPLFQSSSNKYDNAATSEERYNVAVEIAKDLDAQNETSTIVAKNNDDFISMLPIQYADFVRNNRIGAVLYNGTLIINYVNQINADAIRIAHEHENTHIANNEVHTKADLSKLWDNVPENERRLVSKVYEKMEQHVKGDELIAYAVEDIIKKQGYENYKNGNIDLSLYSEALQNKLKKTIDYANNKYLANNEGRTKISGSTNKGTNERFQQVNGEGTSTRKRGTANGTDKLPETIDSDPRGGVYNSPEYKTANKVREILKERGIDKSFSISDTDFGKSMYFTVYGENYEPKLKIRISDHSVSNKDRIFGEQHESAKSDPIRIANDIELAMFPERYNKIQTGVRYYNKYNNQWITEPVENGKAWVKSYNNEATEKQLDNLNPERTRIVSKEFVKKSKSGNKIYKVVLENLTEVGEVPIYKYERKQEAEIPAAIYVDGESANILFEPQQLFIDFTKNEIQDETRKAHGNEKNQQESVIETINNATLLPTNGTIASVSRRTSKRRSILSSKRTVIDGFRESGYVNFNGIQVNTHQDIADLWSVHRSPYIEKTHIIYLKDGVVVGTMAHTAGKIDTAPIASVNEIADYAAQLGAMQIYMLHNHPSGNPTPSLQDMKVTYHIADRLHEYGINVLGQVVVDHDKYSFIDTANRLSLENLNESSLKYALENNTEYYEYKSKKTDFLLDRELVEKRDPQQWLFEYGKKLLSQPEYKAAVVYLSTDPSGKGFVVSAYDVLAENVSKEEILSIVNEGLNENIGRNAIIIHDGSIKGGFGKVHAKLLDIISIQTGGFANDFINDEVSYGEKQTLWISEQQNYQYANEKKALARKEKAKQEVRQVMLNATLPYPEYVEIDHVEESSIIPERPVYVKGESAYDYMQKLKEYEDNLHAVDSGVKEAYQEALASTYSKTQQLKRAHIDEVSPIEQLNDFIRKQGGEINADADAYIDYFNSKGRATYFTTKFDTEYMQKLVDTFVQVRKSGELDGISARWTDTRRKLSNYEKMHVYLQAKDIEEGITLGLVDRGEAGFVNSIGITHAEYIDMFEKNVSKEHIDAMWKAVNNATRFSLDYQLNADMISKETYDKFTKRQYYVPQREWSERERDERPLDYVKRGGGGNPFNVALRKAKGRRSLASDPLPFIQSIAHSSILSAEKNKTKQAMLRTVKANIAIGRKAGAFDFKQSWLINSKTTDADGNMLYDIVYTLPSAELFAEDRETRKEINKLTKQTLEETDTDVIDKLNEKIEDLKSDINIATFEVHDNYVRNRTSEEKKQHEVVVISNGDRFVIQYQDEKVANAINRNFNRQTYDNVVMRALNKGARYMSAILTQYNPVFALWNFARDYQTAIISHAIDFGIEYEARFFKNTIISQKAINDYVWRGKFANSETGKNLELFFETGAATGWSYLFRIEQLKRNLKNQIDPSVIRSIYDGTALPFTVIKKAFSNITEVSELSTRFATFKTSLEMGYSPKEAASHAKEVTVNFDRSGSSKFFSGIFAFFNAQIQGTNKPYRQLTRTKKGKYAIPAVAFALFIGGVVNALLSPDDPDEEKAWAEYDRMNNMLVGNVKIPLTHFYRTFWGMGTQAVLAYQGEKSVEVAMFDGTSNMLSDLFPQTPLSLWEAFGENRATGKLEPDLRKYLQAIAPTATVPMVDVMLNKTFTGAPVAREPFSTKAKEYIPDSQLYKRNVHAFFKGATDAWFTKHGGDTAAKTKGNVPWYGDINPSKVQHIAEGYTGGVGKQLLDLTNFIYGIAKEGAFDETKIPVWNRLVKPYREDKVVAQKYWTLKNKVEYYEQSYNAYRKARAEGSSLSDEKVQQMRDSEKHQLYLEAKTKLHQIDRMMKSERVPSSQDIKELDAYIKQWNKLK